MKQQATHRKDQRGLTLVETLVALTLITAILSVSFGVLHSGQTGWQRVDEKRLAQEQLHGGYNALRRVVEQIQPVFDVNQQARLSLQFSGDSDQFGFSGPVGMMAGGRIYRGQIALQDAALNLTVLPLLDTTGIGQDQTQQWVVLDGVQELQISYWGKTRRELRSRWHSRWRNQTALPQRIRFQFQQQGEQRDWQFAVLATHGVPLGGR